MIKEIRPTHLLHFAWNTAHGKYWTSLENFRWVQSGLGLLQEFYSHGGSRAVMAGTCAEYDWKYEHCSEQATPLSPATLYGICKHSLQAMLGSFCKETGLSSAWGRVFFLYGSHEHPARLVPSVIRSLLQGETARCSHGEQIRDFLHVEDAAAAFVALLESEVAGPVNIASGRPVALKDVICKIADKLNRRDLVQLGAIPAPAYEPPVLTAEVRRLSDEVGWRPKLDLDAGLEQTIAWWKNEICSCRS
ncbi:MAG: NAD(P)-dependent oxidoreductase [bacterium]